MLWYLLISRDVFFIGADIMDGGYRENVATRRLVLAWLMHCLGKRVSIVSFSFNTMPKSGVLRAFHRLGSGARYAVRDRQSLRRFESATGLRGALAADIGFLAVPALAPRFTSLVGWMAEAKRDRFHVLFVNLNVAPFRWDATTRNCSTERLVGAIHAALVSVQSRIESGLAVVVVPHDFRNATEAWSDLGLAQALDDRLKSDFDGRHTRVQAPFNSAEICALLESADIVVTGRMHLAILAIAAGVPPLSFTYQDKFEGMYEDVFSAPRDLILSCATLLNSPDLVADSILAALEKRIALQLEIAEKLSGLKASALANFLS
jgi:polysaccharide pyruvyl transferase WcaK-like protein